jgi:hypothetical protein
MSAKVTLIGHGRATLFTAVTSGVSTPAIPVNLGAFNVEKYSRFTGLVNVGVGSLTVQYQLGVNSGTWIVSSTFAANSGGSAFDVLNPGGRVANFNISAAANSTAYTIGVIAEPLR